MGTLHPNHPGELSLDGRAAERQRSKRELRARARAIDLLQRRNVPFLVGGAYAYGNYTGIHRDTKDLDLFLRKPDAAWALEVLAQAGWRTERTDETWIYKAFFGNYFVDFIFSSGNGVATVDDAWFVHATDGEAFGRQVKLIPPEELIWSKAFVLERERFDGADVMHILRAVGGKLDWRRMLHRFDRYWEVLLAHLHMFRFAYPGERTQVPDWVMIDLLRRTVGTLAAGDWQERLCRGPLISRVNFGVDVQHWGYTDGRKWDEEERGGTRGGAGERSECEGAGGRSR